MERLARSKEDLLVLGSSQEKLLPWAHLSEQSEVSFAPKLGCQSLFSTQHLPPLLFVYLYSSASAPHQEILLARLLYHPKHLLISGFWLMPVLGATSSCPSSQSCYSQEGHKPDMEHPGFSWRLGFSVTLHFQRLLACSYHESCPWQYSSFLCKKNIPGLKLYKCHMGLRHFFPTHS